ncbi:bifunctional hydroxymethylpyrimidine kinase/phosphomethylpyrimidine kinase [Olivibacter ginsenosidimutans]|uniref:hydroxymethylpyrimidine kinase n=1 Tax=Olivibacter ginsenosidimutans TaxID=1176537 RepID=A0ABP9CD70_9SPHI
MDAEQQYHTVLAIAGFDGSGGAGIPADIKTISALGCYATSVLTALPVQNTLGVQALHAIPPEVVVKQLDALLTDIPPQAIKMGMVHTKAIVSALTKRLEAHTKVSLVLDPVMVSSSGHQLMEKSAIQAMITKLFPLTHILTPNLDEASLLAKMPIKTIDDMLQAGQKIKDLGCQSVLLKGGHLKGNTLTTIYFASDGQQHTYSFPKIETPNAHGTGCTLSSAIAAYLARGENELSAITKAQHYVYQALLQGKDVAIGKGKGPLNHFFDPEKTIKRKAESGKQGN